jgi:alkylhydroperoxidase family enzyme
MLDLIRARRGVVPPMFHVLVASPEVARLMEELSARLWNSGLPRASLEAVFLMVARRFGCDEQWRRHEPKALAAGISPACIDEIRRGAPPCADVPLRTICRMTSVLLDGGKVGADLWRAAELSIGKAGLADLCAFIGLAAVVSMTINLQGFD